MTTPLARPALALAFTAMLLRALLPAGWMPDPAGPAGAFITICTMDGPQRIALPGTPKPAPDPGSHDHTGAPCPFSAAAPFAPLAQAAQLTPPDESVIRVRHALFAEFHRNTPRAANGARAPPTPLA